MANFFHASQVAMRNCAFLKKRAIASIYIIARTVLSCNKFNSCKR